MRSEIAQIRRFNPREAADHLSAAAGGDGRIRVAFNDEPFADRWSAEPL